MQAYPNYSQPMMNPYQNNYNPMLSPQQRLMQMEQQYPQFAQQNQFIQQPMQQNQPQGLNCVIVDDFNAISANDVPMDGKGAVFMLRGGSQIEWRNWTANGTIQTVPYSPVQTENTEQATNIPQMDFNALNEDVRALREDIKEMRSMIENSISVQPVKTTRNKKLEVSADE